MSTGACYTDRICAIKPRFLIKTICHSMTYAVCWRARIRSASRKRCITSARRWARIMRVVGSNVDLDRMNALNQLSRRITTERLSYSQVADQLEQIAQQPRSYGRWTTVMIVALACACFSQLFGGRWHEFVAVLIAVVPTMLLRQSLSERGIGPILQIPLVAFVATVIVSLVGRVVGVQRAEIAVPAVVLILVPGVPLITALTDLIGGFLLSSVARGAAIMIVVEISVGVALALQLLRVTGLIGA